MMTNTNIGILTVLTVIIWILTMISGIYWMNVELPWQNSALAFTYILLIMFVFAVITIIIFKKKKWF
jgi:magnesium transporter